MSRRTARQTVDARALSPELQLLTACMRWPPSPARTAAVADALANPELDWARAALAVERHRVAGFVHDGLKAAGATAAPADVLDSFRASASADAMLNLRFTGEAFRIVPALRDAGIEVLMLKGPGLMMLIYGNLTIRHSRDLDLLVPVGSIIQAGEVCQRAGYDRIQPPPSASDIELAEWLRWRKDFVYRHRTAPLTLELHFRATNSPRLTQGLDLWRARREVAIQGGASLPAPDGEALYAYLCLHGALCAWFRLKWLADIAALTNGRSEAELTALHAAAEERGVGRASGQALLLVEAVFGDPLPSSLRRSLVADRKVLWLARFAFRVISDPRTPYETPFGSSQVGLSHLMLSDDWRVWLHEVRGWLIDWPLVFSRKLPRGFRFLHVALRGPVWLARKLFGSPKRNPGDRGRP
ncbi:MAG: nucleotidyltransferase family protein [Caulobacterales bacterium]|nr:nucleotidyltransferase family protein [Caulobacterales bacterium]